MRKRLKPIPHEIDPLKLSKSSIGQKKRDNKARLDKLKAAQKEVEENLELVEKAEKLISGKESIVTEDLKEALPPTVQSMLDAEDVIFKPNPGPQTDFLASTEDQVFYGGARGGGKSYGMLVDPLYHCDKAAHRALILRRTMPELRDLIAKSHQLYPKAFRGAKWREQEKEWRFPSGARIEFGYAENMLDVLRYQGQSYCVAAGTLIRMADDSLRPIQDIKVGDMVATLEGPRPVTATMPPRIDDCVAAFVPESNGKLALQVHPVNHPVLATAPTPSESSPGVCQIPAPLHKSHVQWLSYKRALCVHQDTQETSFGLGDGKNGCVDVEHSTQGSLPPAWLSFPVVLAEPFLLSGSENHTPPIQYPTPDKYDERLSEKGLASLCSPSGHLQLVSLYQSQMDHIEALSSCGGVADAPLAIRKALDSLYDCLSYFRSCGVPPLFDREFGQDASPLRGDVARPALSYPPSDGTDYTLSHNHWHQPETYTHPYTQGQRPVVVPLVSKNLYQIPIGKLLVYDLTIEGANHYISLAGIVNKNTWIGVDELPQFPTGDVWSFLSSSLRSVDPSIKPVMRATGNPGNIGSAWVKEMFIDPAPSNTRFEVDVEAKTPRGVIKTTISRKYIPATVFDNPFLTYDNSYIAMLASLPEMQRRQFLEGDWDAFDNAAFSDFRKDIHVLPADTEIPTSWIRFRAADWGFSSPACCLWFAVDHDNNLYVYRELYTKGKNAEEFARLVLEAEYNEPIRYGVLDSSVWAKRGDIGPSIAETMIRAGCKWRPADRSPNSRKSGKLEIHRRLALKPDVDGVERPSLYILANCRNLIRTLPLLPLDDNNPEDVDTAAEDHAYDALRYGVTSRPMSTEILFASDKPGQAHDFRPASNTFGY
jgi:hypothetical protein